MQLIEGNFAMGKKFSRSDLVMGTTHLARVRVDRGKDGWFGVGLLCQVPHRAVAGDYVEVFHGWRNHRQKWVSGVVLPGRIEHYGDRELSRNRPVSGNLTF